MINAINSTTEFSFCESDWCVACKHKEKDSFTLELEKVGILPSQNIPAILTENLPSSDIISS